MVNPLKIILTQGYKRGSKFNFEKDDCAVIATSIAFQIPYGKAHEIFFNIGRKNCQGVLNNSVRLLYEKELNGYKTKLTDLYYGASKNILKTLSFGRYVIMEKEHFYAFINGVIYDSVNPLKNKRILAYWELSKTP